ncbi:MAG: undecaprenyl-diphosphate phosphatase [Sphaerochaetaceae bacterium]
MSLIEGIIMGVVQGVTEFLPVSSSAHLILARDYLAISAVPLLFDVVLHLATLVVIIVYYRSIIGSIVLSFWRWAGKKNQMADTPNLLYGVALIGSTALTVVVVLLFKMLGIDSTNRTSISVLLIVTAFILFASRFVRFSWQSTALVGWKQALLIGIAQGCGSLAGLSRLGLTSSAALMGGLNPKEASQYSFLLAIPAVVGALLLDIMQQHGGSTSVAIIPLIGGSITAIVVGFAVLPLFVRLIQKGKLWYAGVYLVAIGLFGLLG